MNRSHLPCLFLHPLVVLFILVQACSGPKKSENKHPHNNAGDLHTINNIEIISPKSDDTYNLADTISVSIELKREDLIPDSVLLTNNGKRIEKFPQAQATISWIAKDAKPGHTTFRILAYYGDSLKESKNVSITLLSDIVPEKLRYEIINTYPHDNEAFTQGLVYDNGVLYEGTGQYGKSSLRKVNLKTGEVINMLNMGRDFFGEGIAIYEDKIFQITWKSQVGFIYDKESFTQLQKIYYDTKEGWGLTYNGSRFILSDGTARLYLLEPKYFTQTGQIEVYDQNGMVPNLNELEYIDGLVYANIWGQDIIVVIDYKSGKVLKTLDLSGLVPKNLRRNNDKVLNGIAYNPGNGHLFVTGKYWPVLFEIKILP